jgi:acyl carrier protein
VTRTERAATAAGALPDVEDAVAEAFAVVLERSRESITAESDFFDLGGNSIRGAQVVARLRDTVPVKATIRDLFRARTAGALVTVLRERAAASGARGPARPAR